MKKALIVNPYWDTRGGGERYTTEVIQALLKLNYGVDIAWEHESLLKEITDRYGIGLTPAKVKPDVRNILASKNRWRKFKLMRGYDQIFWLSDGSIPWLWGKNNILHFQVPFSLVDGQSLSNRLKLLNISTVVCNSKFTKNIIDKEFKLTSKVIYPAIKAVPPLRKQPLILSVGRFDNLMHSKRHDVLIATFSKLTIVGWRLVLAGGVLHGQDQVEELRKLTVNKQIELVINPDFETLQKLYGEATIYWHAAGYGQDLNKHPERAEHFGITTVEAMSAGAVPVVFAGGGQPEIVTQGVNGFLWQTTDELIDYTKRLIQDDKLRSRMSKTAELRARDFSQKEFNHAFKTIIG